ncbi:hypothetical protein BJI67_16100 (plasmid) [Acidihalobacter aeolianus]|uniref:Uncharacterized protein n=1 Tax=Acidihalobacter aeolianus TaxID=2792603 RepID=A0A1D8KCU7_9GAMM|nr:hypothetical protein [Acidihalobacter aeolianus]AOV18762.1 hypothetical protein BJI67_16100 [Acidihalobacter aeolianus]
MTAKVIPFPQPAMPADDHDWVGDIHPGTRIVARGSGGEFRKGEVGCCVSIVGSLHGSAAFHQYAIVFAGGGCDLLYPWEVALMFDLDRYPAAHFVHHAFVDLPSLREAHRAGRFTSAFKIPRT